MHKIKQFKHDASGQNKPVIQPVLAFDASQENGSLLDALAAVRCKLKELGITPSEAGAGPLSVQNPLSQIYEVSEQLGMNIRFTMDHIGGEVFSVTAIAIHKKTREEMKSSVHFPMSKDNMSQNFEEWYWKCVASMRIYSLQNLLGIFSEGGDRYADGTIISLNDGQIAKIESAEEKTIEEQCFQLPTVEKRSRKTTLLLKKSTHKYIKDMADSRKFSLSMMCARILEFMLSIMGETPWIEFFWEKRKKQLGEENVDEQVGINLKKSTHKRIDDMVIEIKKSEISSFNAVANVMYEKFITLYEKPNFRATFNDS
ncbi:MAG: hypothetical protein LBI56_01785 [Puniceicoccales bacterium]|jgi:hypothetical protein|nr:hypothetical protein [Puniceicoccales bacterium]